MQEEKLKELLAKKEKVLSQLRKKLIGFQGVVHEDSESELRDSDIKVLQAHLVSIQEEINKLEEGLE